jgi:hypothetical protein
MRVLPRIVAVSPPIFRGVATDCEGGGAGNEGLAAAGEAAVAGNEGFATDYEGPAAGNEGFAADNEDVAGDSKGVAAGGSALPPVMRALPLLNRVLR